MIFYFSGTGNSLYVAKTIAAAQNEQIFSIAKELDKKQSVYKYVLKENEHLGFVFPSYAFEPAKLVIDFIRKLEVDTKHNLVFSVATCGQEEGNSTKTITNELSKKGISLDCGFTVVMPNNYMIGFDIESDESQKEKFKNADILIEEINSILKNKQKGVFKLIPSNFPHFASRMISFLLNSYGKEINGFNATDKCTKCKICEKVCPVHTITVDEKPHWSKGCINCFACINHCPVKAIEARKLTINKGRYLHPNIKRGEN